MAKSTLQAFVNATRQMLTIQLFIGVAAVGLAGWTATVTNQLIRERNALSARVIQLQATIDELGGKAPPPMEPGVGEAAPSPTLEAPAIPTDTDTGKPPQTVPGATPTTATTAPFNPGQIIHDTLAPPAAISVVVLHVRATTDRAGAERIARELGARGLQVSIDVMSPREQHASGYAYFDARQAQAAGAIAAQVREAARRAEIAAWTANLEGAALQATAEYSANRVDIVLPPTATTPPTGPSRWREMQTTTTAPAPIR